MASTCETFFNSVQSEYEEGLALEQQDLINWKYGAQYVHANTNWPRIVCYCSDATWETLTKAGSALTTSEKRPRYNRRNTLTWHCWAATEEGAEVMAANIVIASRRASGASGITFLPGTETWPQAESLDVTSGGSYVILTTQLVFSVTDEIIALPTVEVTAITHRGTFNNEAVC